MKINLKKNSELENKMQKKKKDELQVKYLNINRKNEENGKHGENGGEILLHLPHGFSPKGISEGYQKEIQVQ